MNSLTWESNYSGIALFFVHTSPSCTSPPDPEATNHTRTISEDCSNFDCEVFSPTTDCALGQLAGRWGEDCECGDVPYTGCRTLFPLQPVILADATCIDTGPNSIDIDDVNHRNVVRVQVSEGVQYKFSVPSQVAPNEWAGVYIAIYDNNSTFGSSNPLAFGEDEVIWTATSSDDIYFYVNTNGLCELLCQNATFTTGECFANFEHTRRIEWDCENDLCNVNGGSLTYDGPVSFCVGTGQAKSANVQVSGAVGSLQGWGLFNSEGLLVAQRGNNSQFNLDSYPAGNYSIRYMRYEAGVDVASITSLSSFGTLEGCWSAATNAINLFLRPEPMAGSLTALSSTSMCANAGNNQTSVELSLSGFDSHGLRYAIVSQALGNQVVLSQNGTTSGTTFNLNGLPAGTYRAVAVGFQQGTSLVGVESQSQLTGCFDLSNLVTITLNSCLNASLHSSPNPTSGPSVVTFSNPREEYSLLEVYDMSGRMVQTLFNEVTRTEQEYRIEFNASHLPNGVYLYRLTTGSEVQVSKFVIARQVGILSMFKFEGCSLLWSSPYFVCVITQASLDLMYLML